MLLHPRQLPPCVRACYPPGTLPQPKTKASVRKDAFVDTKYCYVRVSTFSRVVIDCAHLSRALHLGQQMSLFRTGKLNLFIMVEQDEVVVLVKIGSHEFFIHFTSATLFTPNASRHLFSLYFRCTTILLSR